MKQLLEEVGSPAFGIAVLVIFVLFFGGIVYWVFFQTSDKEMKDSAAMPLDDNDVDQRKKK